MAINLGQAAIKNEIVCRAPAETQDSLAGCTGNIEWNDAINRRALGLLLAASGV